MLFRSEKISIVTVCYNDLSSLVRTVNSVKMYKKEYHRYYVIDAMSNDGTDLFIKNNLDVIDEYIIEKDTGIYDGMNKILLLLKEESFIIWINAGDELLSWTDSQIKRIYNYDCAFFPVIQKINKFDKGYLVKPNIYLPLNERNIMPKTLFRHQGFLIKKSIFEKYKYNLLIGQMADWLLMTLCQKNDNIYIGDCPLSVFYLDGISNNKFFCSLFSYYKIVKYLNMDKRLLVKYQKGYIIKSIIKIFLPIKIVKSMQRKMQNIRES